MTMRWFLSLIAVVGLGGALAPAAAQGSLPDDQRALLEKAAAAIQATNDFTSYAEETLGKDSQVIVLASETLGRQEVTTSKRTEGRAVYLRGDNPALLYNVTIKGEESDIKYTIEGELRYVDGVLYASASYIPDDPAQAVLYFFPEGFTIIEDPNEPADYAILEPASVLERLIGEDEGFFDDVDQLALAVESVTSQVGELDGAPVEIITLNVPSDNLFFWIAGTNPTFDPTDPTTRLLFSYLTDDSYGVVAVYLDEDGNWLQSEFELVMNVEGADASQLDPAMEGFTIELESTLTQRFKLSQINAVTEEITAPQIED